MLAAIPYAHLEAAAFIGACLAVGALLGIIGATIRLLRRPPR